MSRDNDLESSTEQPFYVLVSPTDDTTDWESCSIYVIPDHAFLIIGDDIRARDRLREIYEAGFPIVALSAFQSWHDTIENEKLRISYSGLSRTEREKYCAMIVNPFRKRVE